MWAEPSLVDEATEELADLERMVLACEELFGPYRWGRYDVLFLPPSFPFGGMENPCMTFATPTILAGDKSLVALIAHELAHSWSGNLVTNATWRDFWLNEGFTVYLEQRIMEHVYGRDRAAMEIALGMQGLQQELAELPAADQALHIDLTGRNPDDGMTAVAYDKGAAFLRRIEEVFGRDRTDQFLRQWFDEHRFQSVTTHTFLEFLNERLMAGDKDRARMINVSQWVDDGGLPEAAKIPQSQRFAEVDAAVRALDSGASASDLQTTGWVTQQWLRLLAAINAPSLAQLEELDEAFRFTRSGNSEILSAWLTLATRHGYRAVDARLELFLMTVGRRKFLVPLYQALLAAPGGQERAAKIYRRARLRYHGDGRRTKPKGDRGVRARRDGGAARQRRAREREGTRRPRGRRGERAAEGRRGEVDALSGGDARADPDARCALRRGRRRGVRLHARFDVRCDRRRDGARERTRGRADRDRAAPRQ